MYVCVICNICKDKKGFRLCFGGFWCPNKIYYLALFSTPNKCYQLIYAPFKINDGREQDHTVQKQEGAQFCFPQHHLFHLQVRETLRGEHFHGTSNANYKTIKKIFQSLSLSAVFSCSPYRGFKVFVVLTANN